MKTFFRRFKTAAGLLRATQSPQQPIFGFILLLQVSFLIFYTQFMLMYVLYVLRGLFTIYKQMPATILSRRIFCAASRI